MKKFAILIFLIAFIGASLFLFEIRSTSFTSQDITNNTLNATKENAEDALNSSRDIVEGMIKMGLPVLYIQDRLIESENAFNDENYFEVMIQYEKIIERRKESLLVFDNLGLLRNELEQEREAGADTADAEVFFSSAESAFKDDRLDDANKLIEQTRSVLDDAVRESSLNIAFTGAIINFIKRYFVFVVIGISALVFIFMKVYKKARRKYLADKIERLKKEKKVILGLMKQTQFDRYKKDNISSLVYNIRMDSYKERTSKIDQIVPLLESELKKLNKKKNKIKN